MTDLDPNLLEYEAGQVLTGLIDDGAGVVEQDRAAAYSLAISAKRIAAALEEANAVKMGGIESAVRAMEKKLDEQTSDEVAKIAGKYLGMSLDELFALLDEGDTVVPRTRTRYDEIVELHGDLVKLAGSALTQAKDKTK